MKKRVLSVLSIALFTQIVMAADKAPAPNTPIVTVNKTDITHAVFADAMREQLQKGAQDSELLRTAILNELVVAEALAQEANQSKVAADPDVKRLLANLQRSILADAYVLQQLKTNPVTDAQVRSEYDRQVALTKDGRNSIEYKLAQIVTMDANSAQAVLNRLQGGEDFSALAKEVSIDPSAKQNGGDLPWSLPDQLIVPLADHVLELSKGTYSTQAVESNVGYHILKLIDSRPFKAPSFEETKESLRAVLLEQRKQEIIEKVMSKANIKIH